MEIVLITVLIFFLATFFYSFTVPRKDRYDQMLASFIATGIYFACATLAWIITSLI